MALWIERTGMKRATGAMLAAGALAASAACSGNNAPAAHPNEWVVIKAASQGPHISDGGVKVHTTNGECTLTIAQRDLRFDNDGSVAVLHAEKSPSIAACVAGAVILPNQLDRGQLEALERDSDQWDDLMHSAHTQLGAFERANPNTTLLDESSITTSETLSVVGTYNDKQPSMSTLFDGINSHPYGATTCDVRTQAFVRSLVQVDYEGRPYALGVVRYNAAPGTCAPGELVLLDEAGVRAPA